MSLLELDFDLADVGVIDIDPPIEVTPDPKPPGQGKYRPQLEPANHSVRYIIRTTRPVRESELQAEIQALFETTGFSLQTVRVQLGNILRRLLPTTARAVPDLPPLQKKPLKSQIKVERLFKGKYPASSVLNRYYLLTLPTTYRRLKRISRGRDGFFYDLAYKLRTHPLIEDIEPDLPVQRSVTPQSSVSSTPMCPDSIDDMDNPAWARTAIRHPDLLEDHPDLLGTGIVIGLLDTGYKDHGEINHDATFLRDVNDDFIEVNVVEGEPSDSAVDRQSPGLCFGSSGSSSTSSMADTPHGTAVASVICSLDESENGEFNLMGIASDARVLPVRCLIESCQVVSLWNSDIARAFERATNLDYTRTSAGFTPIEGNDGSAERAHVDVISVSFGGYMVDAVWDAIMDAVEKDVIVVAAAGNFVDWVIEPAAFPHVIAVAGTTQDDEPWNASGMGSEVDLSAPALCAVHAAFDSDGSEIVIAGSGTSFSAPAVASAAALWLQHHGIDNLKSQFPNTPLQFVFQCVLRLTARVPDNWNPDYGTGILDVQALIDFDLSDSALQDCLDALPRDAVGAFNAAGYPHPNDWDRMARMFGFASSAEIREAMEKVLADATMPVREFMQSFGAEMVRFFSESEEGWNAMNDLLQAAQTGSHSTLDTAADNFIDEGIKNLSNALVQAANWLN